VGHKLRILICEAACKLQLTGLQEVDVPLNQAVYLSVRIDHFFEIYPNTVPSILIFICFNGHQTQLFVRSTTLFKLMLQVRNEISAIVKEKSMERSYLWHKDEFQLQIRMGGAEERLLNEETNPEEEAELGMHAFL